MKGEWCYFKNHFNKSQCKEILEYCITLPTKDAKIGITDIVDDKYRRSKISFIQLYDIKMKWLFNELWQLAIQANKDWFDFHITRLDYLQFAEYKSTYAGEYKKHQDVFWVTENLTQRKLSCIVQLTEQTEYEGGRLELYDCNQYPNSDEIIGQGTVIFFPSFVQHAALPVTKGTRYSLAAWFEGPHWR